MEAAIGVVGLHNHQSQGLSRYGATTQKSPVPSTDVRSSASADFERRSSMGARRVSAEGGRQLQVGPCIGGGALQVAVISTRGNIMEAVNIPVSDFGALMAAIEAAKEDADREFDQASKLERIERRRRDREALEANPHLNGTRPLGADRYNVRPR